MSRLIDADELDAKLLSDGILNGLSSALNGNYSRRKFTIGEFRSILQNAITVDAVPVVHGKWFRPTQMRDPERICSVCNGVAWNETSYCPNCGAKMEGEE